MSCQYHPVILGESTGGNPAKDESIVGWMGGEGDGGSLAEQAFIFFGRPLVRLFENLLAVGGPYYKSRIVWAGRAAMPEPRKGQNLFNMCTPENIFNVDELLARRFPPGLYPVYSISEKKMVDTYFADPRGDLAYRDYRYIINHTQRAYVDKWAVRARTKYGNRLHALPLLTVEGARDFLCHDPGLVVGSWARDVISVEDEIPRGYNELSVVVEQRG